ncbi:MULTISPECIES: hypothetical protein [unclassified Thioalkalivibrio]|uniref:hypothetical protein n=1 Tax=unclassified Thioalkalivibrio TaxID=2621013 RepID=UPI0012DE394F|nr:MULTISPECIES: hypothetical protein [unclassified Thioalkalivibrio]
MNKRISPAFSEEALFSKSKIYMARGLRAKNEVALDEYQLWASLALELLAKSSLSTIHPALVADPTHYQSLFSACGHPLSPDVKTITAKTLFERLSHVSKKFDKRIQKFCEQQALRRNSEIHSGESPFSGMSPDAWEAKFWHAAYTLLDIQGKELEQWLGADEAQAPRQLLGDARKATSMMVQTRIDHALEDFKSTHKSEKKREELIEESKKAKSWAYYDKFDFYVDGYDLHECPACGGMGVMGGTQYDEEISDDQDPYDPFTEYVEITYATEEFACPVCGLRLHGAQEVNASSLPEEFYEREEREREFEPDYGND